MSAPNGASMERQIAATVTIVKLGNEVHPASLPPLSPKESWAEVEDIRRVWIDLTGDPDQPILKLVRKRKLCQHE